MLAQLKTRLARWLARRDTIEALSLLDRRTLEDIGVVPGDEAGWTRAKLAAQSPATSRPPVIRTGSRARIWSHRPIPNL